MNIILFYRHQSEAHKCPEKLRQTCSLCHRVRVTAEEFKSYSLEAQADCCLEEPINLEFSPLPMECKICNRKCFDNSCFNIHVRMCTKTGQHCGKCRRFIKFTGVYKMGLEKFNGCHRDCAEVYCKNCDDYIVNGLSDTKRIQHTCFIKALRKAPCWPKGIIVADTETTIDGKANVVSMVFPKQKANPMGGVAVKVFTDFSMEDYEQPFPTFFQPENSLPGEMLIQDDPNLGLKAMDLSHLSHLSSFPYDQLIRTADKTFFTPSFPKKNDKRVEKVEKEESHLRNFPHQRSFQHDERKQSVHPLNFPEVEDIHVDPNAPLHSDAEIDDSDDSNESDTQDDNFSRPHPNLVDLLSAVDAEEDDYNLKSFQLHGATITEEDAKEEERLFRQKYSSKKTKSIPDHLRSFFHNEAEVEGMVEGTDEQDEDSEDNESHVEEDIIRPNNRPTNIISSSDSEKEEEQQQENKLPIKDPVFPTKLQYEKSQENFRKRKAFSLENLKGFLVQNPDTSAVSSSSSGRSSPQSMEVEKVGGQGSNLASMRHPEAPCFHGHVAKDPISITEGKAVTDFLKFLTSGQFQSMTILFHNGSGFDFQILIKTAIDMELPLQLSCKGNKILSFSIKGTGLTFLDSYLFIPTSLRKMKTSFGLKSSSKG